MANQIRSKAQLLDLFADNSDHLITPQSLRDFVVSNQVDEGQVETSPGQTMSDFADVFLAGIGCTDMILPTSASYGNRVLNIINASGGELTINGNGGELIDGDASTVLADQQFASLASPPSSDDWLTLVNTGPDVDAIDDYALATITDSVSITDITAGSYVDINQNLNDDGSSFDLSVTPDGITFSGADPKLFAIDVSLTAGKTMGSIEQYTITLALNGTPNGPTMGISFTNGVSDNVSLHLILELSDGDDIKVNIRGDVTSDDVIVTDMILRLTEIKQ